MKVGQLKQVSDVSSVVKDRNVNHLDRCYIKSEILHIHLAVLQSKATSERLGIAYPLSIFLVLMKAGSDRCDPFLCNTEEHEEAKAIAILKKLARTLQSWQFYQTQHLMSNVCNIDVDTKVSLFASPVFFFTATPVWTAHK